MRRGEHTKKVKMTELIPCFTIDIYRLISKFAAFFFKLHEMTCMKLSNELRLGICSSS